MVNNASIPKQCEFKKVKQHQWKINGSGDPSKNGKTIESGFDEEKAVKEAETCLGNHVCNSCDLCRYFCPDLCITRNEQTGKIEIDYNFCKGCGICAFIVPFGEWEKNPRL